MRKLRYTLLHILRTKENNTIKIVSLTLGLTVALVLFSKVALEMSYDTFYPDSERIYRIQRKVYNDKETHEETQRIYASVPGDLQADLEEIEIATVTFGNPVETYLQYEEKAFKERLLTADAHMLDVFGYRIIEGNKEELNIASRLFISQPVARRFFGNENPVGKTMLRDNETLTIAGVFEKIPNTHLDFDVILSIKTSIDVASMGWHNPDPFNGYLKLLPGVSPGEVEDKIQALLPKYMDVEAQAAIGNIMEFYLYPVSNIHSRSTETRRIVLIFSILAFSLLFVSAMNYVLISISSLAKRAKTIGIQKCNGATNRNIFRMFLFETMIITGISLLLSLLLIYVFRGNIENIIQTPVSSLFSPHNLWVAGTTILGLLLLAGIIPAVIFSHVPITQIFRAYATDKRYWKRLLLFVQFTGISFMMTLLIIIVKQYNLLMSNELGYNIENIVYADNIYRLPREQVEQIKTECERIPGVRKASVASGIPIDNHNGISIYKEETDKPFSSRSLGVDREFLEIMDIRLLAGNNVGENSYNYSQAVVNEAFVEAMGWSGSPVGKRFITHINGREAVEVIGVVKDFQTYTLHAEKSLEPVPPVALFALEKGKENWLFGWNRIILRLDNLNTDLLEQLNAKIREISNLPAPCFVTYESRIEQSYRDTLLYRNSTLIASLILLLITVLGLLGFTQDELNRKSKEITIRKIVGANARNILILISKGIIGIALPALLMGFALSYAIGAEWLQQFAVKIPLNLLLFLMSSCLVLGSIILCITARGWHVANENPVKRLHTE